MIFLAETHSIGSEEVNSWKASEIHKSLKVKSRFNTWIERRISKNYFIENFDYVKVEIKTDGRPFTEYYITLDMAKHLCMLENNEEGFKARKYFIEVEKTYREEVKPFLIDGKDPMAIIRGLKSQLAQHIKKIELQNKNIDELLEQNATLALPAPSVDVEPYKKELRRLNSELHKMEELKDHFSSMAGNQVQKTIALKNVPKQIKQQLGQFLDYPKAYEMLEALANGLEENNRRVA